MRRRSVQGVEVVPGKLNLRSRGDLVTQAGEDIDDLVDRLSENVMHADRRLDPLQGYINPVLFQEAILRQPLENGAATSEEFLQPALHLMEARSDDGTLFLW